MKNFVFLSPNFPANYWNFCKELKNNGINVLGIGDCPYDNLTQELKTNLNEYYYVSDLGNYNSVYRAVAFFCFKYGKIDYLESNNEYWLERDAMLRDDFNITSGFKSKDMPAVKYKSKMKENYKKAGIPVAEYYLVENIEGCKKFISTYGYPVIVKPDNGVGANDTYRIENDKDLENFFKIKPQIPYIMEEYIDGEICSYDAIINSEGTPIFETGNVSPVSIMDIVNENRDSVFYMQGNPEASILEKGRKVAKAFNVRSRFIHFEFFKLLKDQRIGKKGAIVALEVNMRPSGGVSPDMMNYANSIDVYKVWADMIAFDKTQLKVGDKYNCIFVGRRNNKNYKMSIDEIKQQYASNLKKIENVPIALSGAMGNVMILANFEDKEKMKNFYYKIIEKK